MKRIKNEFSYFVELGKKEEPSQYFEDKEAKIMFYFNINMGLYYYMSNDFFEEIFIYCKGAS